MPAARDLRIRFIEPHVSVPVGRFIPTGEIEVENGVVMKKVFTGNWIQLFDPQPRTEPGIVKADLRAVVCEDILRTSPCTDTPNTVSHSDIPRADPRADIPNTSPRSDIPHIIFYTTAPCSDLPHGISRTFRHQSGAVQPVVCRQYALHRRHLVTILYPLRVLLRDLSSGETDIVGRSGILRHGTVPVHRGDTSLFVHPAGQIVSYFRGVPVVRIVVMIQAWSPFILSQHKIIPFSVRSAPVRYSADIHSIFIDLEIAAVVMRPYHIGFLTKTDPVPFVHLLHRHTGIVEIFSAQGAALLPFLPGPHIDRGNHDLLRRVDLIMTVLEIPQRRVPRLLLHYHIDPVRESRGDPECSVRRDPVGA